MSNDDGLGLGFIGLGNMGGPMAANLARAHAELRVYDKAGASLAPEDAVACRSAAALAAKADTVLLCLPDGTVCDAVARELIEAPDTRVRTVVDHSTIGIAAAEALAARFADAGIEYADAPVSGGVAGARKATIALMYAGSGATLSRLAPAFSAMAKNIFHVGEKPGQGQAMKLLNNFLSGVAMAATSEAVAFGARCGLDMKTMLDVLNVSTGQNTATADKFPNRILSERYDAGFTSALFKKDLGLYEQAAAGAGAATPVSPAVIELWRRLEAAEGNIDMTRIYPFVRDRRCGDA